MTNIVLTDTGKEFMAEHYPQSTTFEYDPDGEFQLHAVAAEFVEFTCIGVPYRMPHKVDGEQTWNKAEGR